MAAAWLASVVCSAIAAALLSALGYAVKKSAEASIQHRFDAKLEHLKAETRREEEVLRAAIRAREAEIEGLRSGALANLASRHAEIGKRKIVAIERVWAHAVELAKFKNAAKMLQSVNMTAAMEAAAKQTLDGQKTREFADMIWRANKLDESQTGDLIDKERPFLPVLAWAVFSAYRQAIFYPVVQLMAMKSGAGAKMVAGPDKIMNMIEIALPHQKGFLAEHKATSFPFLIDELEERLFDLLAEALKDPKDDEGAIQQASQILKAVKLAADATEAARSPSNP